MIVFGILGAAAAITSILLVGDIFGYLGSAAYLICEDFNRAIALFLVLQTAAIVDFGIQYRVALGRVGRVILAVVSWLGMTLGTAADK